MTKGPVQVSQRGGAEEAEEPRGARAVSMELCRTGEAVEPRGVGAVSVEVHRAGGTEVEKRRWVVDMALIGLRFLSVHDLIMPWASSTNITYNYQNLWFLCLKAFSGHRAGSA